MEIYTTKNREKKNLTIYYSQIPFRVHVLNEKVIFLCTNQRYEKRKSERKSDIDFNCLKSCSSVYPTLSGYNCRIDIAHFDEQRRRDRKRCRLFERFGIRRLTTVVVARTIKTHTHTHIYICRMVRPTRFSPPLAV